VDPVVTTIERALRTHRFRFVDERELQIGIDQVLRSAGLEVTREASLGAAGTIDFLVGDVGVEIKVRGTRADVTRQVHRYLQSASLRSLVLVTTRATLRGLPEAISQKPVHVVHLLGGLL
jgi:hypothetical protein